MKLLVLVAALVAMTAGLWLFTCRGRSLAIAETIHVPSDDPEPVDPGEGIAVSGRKTSEVAPADEPLTAGQFLKDYWGEEWPEIEKSLLDAGVDLGQEVTPVSWEEAEPGLFETVALNEAEWDGAVNKLVSWYLDSYDMSYEDWLARTFKTTVPLAEHERMALESVCAPYNEQLRQLGENYATQLEVHLKDRWRRGDFLRAPFSTVGLAQERGFYSTSTAQDGWSYVITLKKEDCPDITQTLEEGRWLRDQRRQAGREYLDSLGPR